MGLAHEKKSYLQEKVNLFEIGSEYIGRLVKIKTKPERLFATKIEFVQKM